MRRRISSVFRNYPVKRKLMLFFLLLSLVSILITSFTFLFNQFYNYNRNAREEIRAQASILARNTAASLTFADKAAANEILAGLKANPRIVAVALFASDNSLFTSYVASDANSNRLRSEFTALLRPGANPEMLFTALQKAAGDFPLLEMHPLASEPIILDNQLVGTIVIQTDLHYLYRDLLFLAVIMACVALITFIIAWLLAARFQQIISDPIILLSDVMKQVSREKNYTLRVVSETSDEIGVLINGFNEMLQEIQNRDRIVFEQQQLLLSEKNSRIRLLTAAVEQSANSIVITTPQGEIEYVNPHFCATTGYAVEDILGQNHRILNAETGSFDGYAEIRQTVLNGRQWTGEFQNRKKTGELFWEQTTFSPVLDDRGTITSLLAIMVDITERKRAEEEMRQAKEQAEAANRAKSQFLATMSHELRTPMNGVIGMSQLLEMTELSEEQREYTNVILDSGKNLMTVINDILDLSKIESGRIEIDIHGFDLYAVILGTVKLLSLRAREKGLELVTLIDPDVPKFFRGDAGRLCQILSNLLGNAIKFTPHGSVTLHLYMKCEDDDSATLKFSVRDTGIGIAADKLELIFDPFTQADGSTTRAYGGTGLGLSISRQLAELMGGVIDVESVEGEGSTFRFTVTLLKQTDAVENRQGCLVSGDHAKSPMVNNIRLLLVEDNPTNQLVITSTLTKFGYRVDVAENGSEALKALETVDYALVLMDCMMPVMNGFEATAAIRDQASPVRNHAIPVIALTAKAFREDRDMCLASGMNDYLSKPVSVPDLLNMLEKWLAVDSMRNMNAVRESGTV